MTAGRNRPTASRRPTTGYGWLGSLMALDIAVIQDKYGVNEDWATGNDSYVLKDVNEAGHLYSSIWDAGGIDQIVYNGARDTNIDLRAATLQYEYGGGGWMSYAYGIYGGFTIANGVTIENATGGSGNDMLIGNHVANILIGGGGLDTLVGGGGNDIYRVEEAGDVVVEAAGGGADSVYAVASYALTAGTEVELLSAIDPGAAVAINLTGNEYGNTLIGTAGANVLIGGGGNDALAGLGGNDIYRVEDGGDIVFEGVGGGFDAVYVTLSSYTLNAGAEVELVSAIDPTSTAAFSLTGNAFGNTLIGNAGANVLIGGGGNDALAGLGGNDVYRVEDAGDVVLEGAGGGFDSVYATVNYALAGGAQVELLSGIDPTSSGALNLTGNELGQTIIGTAGANVLTGGGGADAFAFLAAPGAGNVDTITDFASGIDKILLDDAGFAGIGSLPPGAFVTGTAAQDVDDRIIYNQATGQLFFDADGSGAGAAVLFATLQGAPTLTAGDFLVI